ncbi:MAG: hypothetical protein EOP65_05935 [Sphingomonas sp.]|jgi:hypothetical protein|uniref:hypothetical protein n=1 Tax=Sphingomonas sp. CD22 TaxID=3100214 RepID=UPI001201E245|nr:hypothetical protein [Sphingomonas sp. CD22]MEA1084014.1 hypothetical protein [Sphingomonas sp. CD22]RZL58369.1 MAG: hypothetical protein EOP65_05935 [Sphingomonas sp.]
MNPEAEYLRRRELHELHMARRAQCKRARRVHHHLAAIYATRRADLGPAPMPVAMPVPGPWRAWRSFWRLVWD